MKLSSEFDSEVNYFIHKFSSQVLNGVAKVKARVQMTLDGKAQYPLLGIFTKHVAVDYDVEDKNALVTLNGNLKNFFHFTYRHDVQEKKGTLHTTLQTEDRTYKADASFNIRPEAFTRATVSFPYGQVTYVPDSDDEYGEAPGVSASLAVPVLRGLAYADYSQPDESLDVRYTYKDDEITVTPAMRLPQKDVMITFKRRFNRSNKLSLMYDFRDVVTSVVYKYEMPPNLKSKIGYDSRVRLLWGCFWLGEEDAGAKAAPKKLKAQLMVQVPQDDWRDPVFLFKIKKRVDLF
eukprot:jgi/Mesen1/4943/ME000247S04232